MNTYANKHNNTKTKIIIRKHKLPRAQCAISFTVMTKLVSTLRDFFPNLELLSFSLDIFYLKDERL